MPLWGNNDAKSYQGTTLAVENGNTTITGTSTKFQEDIKPGDVLVIVSGTTTKNRVSTITSNTVLNLTSLFTGSTAASLANTATKIQQQPKFAFSDANKPSGANNIATVFGLDNTEISVQGKVTSVSVGVGGTLYVEAPTVAFSGGGGSSANRLPHAVFVVGLPLLWRPLAPVLESLFGAYGDIEAVAVHPDQVRVYGCFPPH